VGRGYRYETSGSRPLAPRKFTLLDHTGILVFYLVGLGLSESQTGLLLSLTLGGDVLVSLFLTTRACGGRSAISCRKPSSHRSTVTGSSLWPMRRWAPSWHF
jgi:hypothetical protein